MQKRKKKGGKAPQHTLVLCDAVKNIWLQNEKNAPLHGEPRQNPNCQIVKK